MGKRKLMKEDVMNHAFVVRLNDLQYSIIEGYAKEMGISMAEYIRRQAVHGKVDIYYNIKVQDEDLQAVAKELHGIGSNLNQIAKYFNLDGLQSKEMREEINKAIEAIVGIQKNLTEWSKERYGSIKAPRK